MELTRMDPRLMFSYMYAFMILSSSIYMLYSGPNGACVPSFNSIFGSIGRCGGRCLAMSSSNMGRYLKYPGGIGCKLILVVAAFRYCCKSEFISSTERAKT